MFRTRRAIPAVPSDFITPHTAPPSNRPLPQCPTRVPRLLQLQTLSPPLCCLPFQLLPRLHSLLQEVVIIPHVKYRAEDYHEDGDQDADHDEGETVAATVFVALIL